MAIMRRMLIGGGAVAVVLAGSASAQAWTWASSSNPIVMTGGGGYGNVNFGTSTFTLQSWLRDTKVGDGRVYAKAIAYTNSSGEWRADISSGLRTDGEATYARMADKSNGVGSPASGFSYKVRTCRSVTLNDPCSTDVRSYNF